MRETVTPELQLMLKEWRHSLHRIPELGFEERETSSYVADVLRSIPGMEVAEGIGGTGVVGSLTLGTGTGVIGLRADMDCLPLTEKKSCDYTSRNEGRMHACGHDGHMAMVLGAAAALAHNGGFSGTVRFIFQPAEEPGQGAKAMVADGLFSRFPVDAMFALHNAPGLPAGTLHFREGAVLASEDDFEIRIVGLGGHSSAPDTVVDPLVIAANVVLALQTVVSRDVRPVDAAVLSCTELLTDGSRNAIPGEVILRGDTRTFTPEMSSLVEKRIRAIAEGICSSYGAHCEVTYTREFEPTVNDAAWTLTAISAAVAAAGQNTVDPNYPPQMASEDFGVFAREVPGCYAFIGNGVEAGRGGTPLHNSDYDFNDEILVTGVGYFVALAQSILN